MGQWQEPLAGGSQPGRQARLALSLFLPGSSPAHWRSPRPSLAPASPPPPPSPLLPGLPLLPPRLFLSFSLSQTLERRPQDDNHIPSAPIASNFPLLSLTLGGAAISTHNWPWSRLGPLGHTKGKMRRAALGRTLCAFLASAKSEVGGRRVLRKAELGGGSSPSTLHSGFSLLPEVSRLSRRPEIQVPGRADGCWHPGHNKAGMTAFLRQPLQQVGKSQA